MQLLSDLLAYAGILLEFVLLFLLIRGPLGRYFPLFMFALTMAALSLAEGWILNAHGTNSRTYFNLYWGGELMVGLLQMVLVISVTLRALEGNPLRPKVARLLGVIFLAAALVPFLILDGRLYSSRWNGGASQILNFAAAIMNLMLWASLIANKNRDRQLLTVSAGMGLALASAAMTLGMREFTSADSWGRSLADWSHRILQIAAFAIWCWAFRPARKMVEPAPTAASSL